MANKSPTAVTPLTLQLQVRGVTSAQELASDLGLDRSSISRGLSTLGSRVVRFGAARSARYALRRTVRNLGDRWPLYRLDERGRASELGLLHSLHGGFWLETKAKLAWLQPDYRDGVFPGLPFFLSDVCPQGFIGRAAVREISSSLGVPSDPRNWQDDDALAFLLNYGSDTPGDLVLGDLMLTNAITTQTQRAESALTQSERADHYITRAIAAMQGDVAGSSAGGEQPKFTATVRADTGAVRAVIVKFSPPVDTPAGRRWADLLAAEYHALTILAAHQEESASAELLDAGERRFLEVTRFDRTTSGRTGVLSLQAIESGLINNHTDSWPTLAAAMQEQGLLSPIDTVALQRRWCFGQLIGNTDMHLGNAAVRFGHELPFRLAPVYDMLPMTFAPTSSGEIVARPFSVIPPLPRLRAEWNTVLPWAIEFWSRVESDDRISRDFRAIAERARETVASSVPLG